MKTISIIIPVYKDTLLSAAKIDNLMSLRYPVEYVEIIIAHGGAISETVQILQDRPLIKIVHTKVSGKIAQLNKALSFAHGEIIVQSDIDSSMTDNCLQEIDKAFEDEKVMCAGVWTSPEPAMWFEKFYWYVQNWLRYLESRFVSTSHVCAPCFAYRKALMWQGYQSDVIADDVFVPWLAMINGFKAVYLKTAQVKEIRNPTTIRQWLKHKGRKGNAFLRELLRLQYLIFALPGKAKIIYWLRLLQFSITSGLNYPFYQQDDRYEKCK